MITWRRLSEGDSNRLSALVGDCQDADGDDPISHPLSDALKIIRQNAQNTLCAETGDGRLAAAGWIEPLEGLRVVVGGCVQPAMRRRGLGNRLLEWAEQRAAGLAQSRASIRLGITNEALSEGAHQLYLGRGFEQVMAEEMRVCDLAQPLPAIDFPGDALVLAWSVETAGLFFQAYHRSFQDRPGFPALSAEEWINGNLDFEGFRPDLCLLALLSGDPAGFLTADAFSGLGWISQVGVAPAWRRQGLAKALIVEALRRFKDTGYQQAALHVNVNNPAAINLYARLGFAYHLKRGRYEKEITPPSTRDGI